MDEQRLFLLTSMQQARQRQFDGPPVAPWEVSGVHSLPPVPDKPKKAMNATPVSRTPMADRPNVERVITAEGKTKWVLSAKITAEVRSRLLAGDTAKMIANVTGLSTSTVSRVASGMRREIGAPALIHPSEPARTHVLDWRQRMSRYEFEGEPGQGKPKKSRKRVCAMTRAQLGETLRSHGVTVALAINCAAPANAPGHQPARASTESPRKPLKTRYLSQNHAGQKVFDVDVKWRDICTA